MIILRRITNFFKKKDKKYKSDIKIKNEIYSQSSIYSFSDIGGCIVHIYFKYDNSLEKDLKLFAKLLSKFDIRFIYLEDKISDPILFLSSDNDKLDQFLYNIYFNENISSTIEDNVFMNELLKVLTSQIDGQFFLLSNDLFSEVYTNNTGVNLNTLDNLFSEITKTKLKNKTSDFTLSILGTTKPNVNIWNEYNINPTVFNINSILSECYMDLLVSSKFFSVINEITLCNCKVIELEGNLLYYIRVKAFDFCELINDNKDLFGNILNILRTNTNFIYPEKPYYYPMVYTSNNNIYDYWVEEINIIRNDSDNDEGVNEDLYSDIDEVIS